MLPCDETEDGGSSVSRVTAIATGESFKLPLGYYPVTPASLYSAAFNILASVLENVCQALYMSFLD